MILIKTYVCHRRGEERENHKYIARILLKQGSGRKPNIYRYFYDKEKYQTYLRGKQESQQKMNIIKNTTDNIFIKGQYASKNILSKIGDKKIGDLEDIVDDFKVFVDNIAVKMKDVVSAPIKKLEENIQEKKAERITENREAIMKPQAMVIAKSDIQDQIVKGMEEATKQLTVARAATDFRNRFVKDWKQAVNKQTVARTFDDNDRRDHKQFPDLKLIDKLYTNDQDMALINPKYDPNSYAYNNNCSYCTAAYEMRKRGFDVEASPRKESDDPTYVKEISSWFKDAEVIRYTDIVAKDMNLSEELKYLTEIDDLTKPLDDSNQYEASRMLEKELLQYGNGARGYLNLYWEQGSGHSVAWEVENGEVVIRDCQVNKEIEIYDYVTYSNNFNYFRTDNLELSDEIRRVVCNRT